MACARVQPICDIYLLHSLSRQIMKAYQELDCFTYLKVIVGFYQIIGAFAHIFNIFWPEEMVILMKTASAGKKLPKRDCFPATSSEHLLSVTAQSFLITGSDNS